MVDDGVLFSYIHRLTDEQALDHSGWRTKLDRRRLEEAHLQYAILKCTQKFPEMTSKENLGKNMFDSNRYLEIFTPILQKDFVKHYSKHVCTFPGCRNCIVVDGNMKNNRDICAAKHAGFVEFVSLGEEIQTGCIQTPAFKSSYCKEHSARVCELNISEEADSVPMGEENGMPVYSGPVTRAQALRQNALNENQQPSAVIEKLVGERVTRQKVYYKVKFIGESMETWEPEEAIPKDIIERYKKGEMEVVAYDSINFNGQVTTTVNIKQGCDEALAGTSKRARKGGNCESMDQPLETPVSCLTEKEKQCKGRQGHDRSAGILAVIRPCGIIMNVSELFRVESKSLVYAVIHEMLSNNEILLKELEYVIYDDACHLKKYAQNPVRNSVTRIADKLNQVHMMVDKMHMKGHVDPWCKANCDPNKDSNLDKVDSEICEQTFSWLSKYGKMTRRMTQNHFLFFVLYLCILHNEREIEKLLRGGFL